MKNMANATTLPATSVLGILITKKIVQQKQRFHKAVLSSSVRYTLIVYIYRLQNLLRQLELYAVFNYY